MFAVFFVENKLGGIPCLIGGGNHAVLVGDGDIVRVGDIIRGGKYQILLGLVKAEC